jgi:hypothetical protein
MSVSQANASNPDAPEYGKGYKPENNAGCPCHIVITTTRNCATVVQRFTRYNQSTDLVEEQACSECPTPTNVAD